MPETAEPKNDPKTDATAASATAKPAAAKPAAAKPATAAPAAAAKPAAAVKPAPAAKPKAGEASPNAVRPGVVYGDIRPLPTPDVVVNHHHVATSGETVALLAQTYYGDRAKADVIRKGNPSLESGEPTPGQTVVIPKG